MANVRIYRTDKGIFVTDESNIILAENGRPSIRGKRAIYEIVEMDCQGGKIVAACEYTAEALEVGYRVNSRWAPGVRHAEKVIAGSLREEPLVKEVRIVDGTVYLHALESYRREEIKHSDMVSAITTNYKLKIDVLEDQIVDLENKRNDEIEKVSKPRTI